MMWEKRRKDDKVFKVYRNNLQGYVFKFFQILFIIFLFNIIVNIGNVEIGKGENYIITFM